MGSRSANGMRAIFHSQGFVLDDAVYVRSAMAFESAPMAGDSEVESRTSEEAEPIPVLPLFVLFMLSGLLGLFGIRRLAHR